VRRFLPAVSAPTLVLHRRDDRMISVGNGRYLAEHLPNARFVELDGADHFFWTGDQDSVLAEIEEFFVGTRASEEADRVLATILFTDIVDSTRVAGELGDARWRELLDEHDAIVGAEVDRHRGQTIKHTGDGYLASFDGPARAIRCADAIVRRVEALGVAVRAGLHTGECERRGADLSGVTVHLAARVAEHAAPGEVLVSRTVTDLLVGSELAFRDRGEHELRGIDGTWRLFAVDR
jgi:class 3 adenylate cyclase